MNWSDIAAAAATLFFVMDPLGNIPVFNAVLSRFSPQRRAAITARELVIALVILLLFLFAGTAILEFLGLSQPSLAIAGGVLLFIIALKMIFPTSAGEVASEKDEPFIVPLAMPMVAGPSTIAILLLLSSTEPERIWEWCTALVIAWAATTVLLTASPFLLRALGSRGLRALERLMGMSSPFLLRALGSRGLRALERLMGMLLVLLATQMLLDGVREFVQSLG